MATARDELQEVDSLQPGSAAALPAEEEQKFQDWIRGTGWFKEFQKQYGEEPDLDTREYDYRAAWKAGVQPEKDPYDQNRYHWPSSLPSGEMLKSASHPTAWKETFMRQTGVNPDALGIESPEQAQRYLSMVTKAQGIAPYGIRWSDVTTGQPPVQAKGLGYMGKIPNESGDSMTELSTTFEINGQPIAAPLIVPGLTEQEIQSLQQGSIPETVYAKAYDHAIKRLSQGQDPFATGQDLRRYQEGGEVQPLESGYLRFPEEARVTPTTSADDLARLGKQAGLIGLGFAPGAGMADYLGYFPSAEGGTEPSAMQNIQQGNYGTAAMQGLGAMGDLMYAVPFLGATVGSALKGPRTAQRMLQELPKVDDLGFYSQVEKAVLDNPQKKGTGQQFLAQIQKTPGVKQEELQYTGLDQFLASKPSVTKDEILDYLDANKVQVKEFQLGTPPLEWSQIGNTIFTNMGTAIIKRLPNNKYQLNQGAGITSLHNSVEEAKNAALTSNRFQKQVQNYSRTKFSQWTLPGGENQREIYLTLPQKPVNPIANEKSVATEVFERTMMDKYGGETFPSVYRQLDPNEIDKYEMLIREERNSAKTQSLLQDRATNYRVPEAHSVSSEADVNRLAQLRVNDRVIDGKNTLFIEEIQSDWHQAGRKQGYATSETKRLSGTVEQQSPNEFQVTWEDGTFSGGYGSREAAEEVAARGKSNAKAGVPDAPFKTSWDELTLKRAIKLASDEGYDQIAFTTGKTQADRYKLSKYLNEIHFSGSNLTAYDKQGNAVIQRTGVSEAELPELIGKEAAEKLLSQPKQGTLQSLVGQELEVGGEGMKGFYDKMLPKKLEKIGKKYGAKVEKTTMDTPDGPVEVWSMQLPDDLKETVSTQGQPLFQIGAGAAGTAGIMSLTGEEAEAAQ